MHLHPQGFEGARQQGAHGSITNGSSFHLRSFDPATGRPRTDTVVPGFIVGMAFSDHAVWIRASIEDGVTRNAAGGYDEHDHGSIYRVDPHDGTATVTASVDDNGPIAAYRDHVVFADHSRLVIQDEDGREVASASTIGLLVLGDQSAVTTVYPVDPWRYALVDNDVGPLWFDAHGIFALDERLRQVVAIDPSTATATVVQHLPDLLQPTEMALTTDDLWVSTIDHQLVRYRLPLTGTAEPAETTRLGPGGILADAAMLAGSSGDLLLFSHGTHGDTVIDTTTRASTPVPDTDTAFQSRPVTLDGRPWVATWRDSVGAVGDPPRPR